MPYRAPVSEFQFLFDHVVGFGQVQATERFAHATGDVTQAILTEAGRMCQDVLAPLQRNGDLSPARLENGVVRTSPGFDEGYRAISEGGWIGMSASEEAGGMALPQSLTSAVNEMMAGACLSLQLNPLMSQGQIEALEHHASEEIRRIYLPKLISGEWCGTMNLTEPQAGSDVGALRTRAEDNGDGSFAITGQKIFISWGDNDFTGNVCHLVLARLPDAPEGTRGISLFMVPKRIPDQDGNAGMANSLKVVSLEHKLGLHGSPTAVMQYDGATGWMVGPPNGGMKAMFTMMNNARLGVGVQGIGAGEGAYQTAVAYANERRQGKTGGADGTIIEHADVRRMLMEMRARLFAARAIAAMNGVAIDMATATGDPAWAARAALLTPMSKAYGTDTGIEVAQAGIQVHGGMGYIEETGAAQYLRDARVTAIYEGTNGIQALDLVGRKMMDGGEAARALLDELAGQSRDDRVLAAIGDMRQATDWLIEADQADRQAGATVYLRAFSNVIGAACHERAAAAEDGAEGPRKSLAAFFIARMLPENAGLLSALRAGSGTLYGIAPSEMIAG